ncbi:hypothetical protein ABPG74_000951 [Tetrahymena malaccensis]
MEIEDSKQVSNELLTKTKAIQKESKASNSANNAIESQSKNGKSNKKSAKQEIPKEDYKTKLKVCKFIKLFPQSIECMAYSGKELNYVAVSRADSSIEIWRSTNWSQIIKFQNSEAEKAVHLVFYYLEDSKQTVLLAFCANGLIKLYDFNSLKPKHEYTNPGGYIWGVSKNPHTQEILTACEDGFLRIFNVDDELGLKIRFVSTIRNFEERAIDVCWDCENPEEFYGSYDSGLIRKFNKAKQVVATMNVKENYEKTVGWRIQSMKDNQLVVGCSDGQIRIFETRFGTVLRSFRKHEADVMTLAYNQSKECFYASGADSKIVVFKLIRGEWIMISEDRGQSHDIKSLILIDDGNALISGGLTTDICYYVIEQDGKFQERAGYKKGEKKKLRHIIGLDQNLENSLEITQDNFLLLKKAFSVELWEFDTDNLNYQLLLEVKTKSYIQSASLSALGEYLAYSTENETYVFGLMSQISGTGQKSVKLQKLCTLPPQIFVKFSEGQAVSQTSSKNSGFLLLLDFQRSLQIIKLTDQFDLTMEQIATLDVELSTAQHIVLGPKNKSVFIGSKINNTIVEIGLSNKNLGNVLFEVPQLCEGFHFNHIKVLTSTKQLVISYENRKFALFDLITKQPSKWTKDNFDKLPQSYLNRNNHIMGILKHPKVPRRIILYTSDSFIIVDLNSKAPKYSIFQRPEQPDKEEISTSFTIKEFSKPVIFAREGVSNSDKIISEDSNNITLFQIDFAEMLANLPGAVMSKKFGN